MDRKECKSLPGDLKKKLTKNDILYYELYQPSLGLKWQCLNRLKIHEIMLKLMVTHNMEAMYK